VLYTEGVRQLAIEIEAYWLLDLVATHLVSREYHTAARRDPRLAEMSFWRLEVADDRSAVLTARTDAGVTPCVTREIPWTDFPLDSAEIWAAREGDVWVVYLPEEP
jgi:hypothetical protein